ncbi:beta-1 adrenergic receptor-like, partial [Actinia tenebrosa]|uniref:Beta-1 adrenergic receptor-like n=1 Tax=Actinia tenebrosa TaxID=6105 RepID=A0A6P8HBR2_ACTTE
MDRSFENCPRIAQVFIEKVTRNRPEWVDAGNIINIFVNAILAVTATLGNGMIIVAILRSQNLQTPSYLLITTLAFADLLFGLMIHPLHIVGGTFFLQGNIRGLCAMASLYIFFGLFLGSVSVMIVTCISIDRYLALTLRHRYTIIVTKKRVRYMIVFVCVLAFLGAFPNIFEKYFDIFSRAMFSCYMALLLITCVFYIKSFRALHLYTVQVHAQQPNPLAINFDVVRYKKTLKTMLLVLACLLICYVPSICAFSMWKMLDNRKGELVVYFTTITLICLNSSINPIIYLIRFADIRNAISKAYQTGRDIFLDIF